MAEAVRFIAIVIVFLVGYLVGSVETTTEFAGVHFCDDCGSPLEQVRPGKWQCRRCG